MNEGEIPLSLQTMESWRQGVARSQEFEITGPLLKAVPKTDRPIQDYSGRLLRRIPPKAASSVEDTRRVPCIPTFPILGNTGTQSQFHPTTTGTYRNRGGI